MTSEEENAQKLEEATENYITENQPRIEALLRTAFLAGFDEGLNMAQKIYHPEKE